MKKAPLWLLFLWRLEQEKGFDLIFDFINQYPNKELPFELYIFWSWSYEQGLLELSYRFKQIHYFWWKPLTEVERYLDNIDYCLMPSKFLETFWLSAINVLKRWIPVIWFKKGGLIPFIQDRYDISQCKWSSDFSKFSEMILKLQEEKENNPSTFYKDLAKSSILTASKYTKEKRFENFKLLSSDLKGKKIVMVSDFINKIWGIETYIHDVKEILEKEGYEVKLFWNTCPKWRRGKYKKLFWIWIGLFNIIDAIKFRAFIRKENPDLIRYHSMIRWMGWMPLYFTRNYKAKKWMMYHDFWYFTPYPHKLYETKGLEKLTFKNYLNLAHTKNPLKLLMVSWKYASLNLLIHQLKNQIDLHLTPSEFMVPIVSKAFWISKEKVKAFNHFLQD